MKDFDYKRIDISILTPNADCEHKDNIFYNKKVVFTGDLERWDRPTAASMLQALGADVNTSISKKTNIVIVGTGAGPVKLIKIIDLIADGIQITLMNERLFEKEIQPYKHLLGIT